MNINGKHFTSIWMEEKGDVKIIDQRKLPFDWVIETLSTVEDFYQAIRQMKVRGAPLIGTTAAFGMMVATREALLTDDFAKSLKEAANYLKTSRPTAVDLFYAIDRMEAYILAQAVDNHILAKATTAALTYQKENIQNCKSIGENGLEIIQNIADEKGGEVVHILTHCNAGWLATDDYGTATAPIYLAHDRGIRVHVWVDETRPRNQGARLTAWELRQHGVPHTVIADNTGGHLMQHHLVDMVLVGSDRTTRSGDVANKIGTYLKALAAKDNGVPFYVALPSSTIDWTLDDGLAEIPIEERSPDEVTFIDGLHDQALTRVRLTPEGSLAANYAFDVTPARLVTGLITEKGVCKASKEGISRLFGDEMGEM
ncbi:MAG TPA: S-methyl-5-thioribose-1-phosphate isomerase [Saprospiraceae bacterium]|nr:S-methyl-5-thioribose-1-phosphate isomerase [Saprospiraceae bacterium]